MGARAGREGEKARLVQLWQADFECGGNSRCGSSEKRTHLSPDCGVNSHAQ